MNDGIRRIHLVGQCQLILEELNKSERFEDTRVALLLAIDTIKNHTYIPVERVENAVAGIREDLDKLCTLN